MERIILKSIEEEAADCRAAFANSKVGDLVNFCHHEEPVEALFEPAETRIDYILNNKPWHEQALRLRLFRPANREEIKWKLAESLRALAIAYTRFAKQRRDMDFESEGYDYAESSLLDDLQSGLYRAARVVGEKIMETYPFENLFGVKWTGDIFSTFEYETKPEQQEQER